MGKLLQVQNLRVSFPHQNGRLNVVEDISFSVHSGEMVGVVGESGAGKSMTSLAIMNLIPQPGRVESGESRPPRAVSDDQGRFRVMKIDPSDQ